MTLAIERLDEANACHDDDPARGAALLREIDPAQLPADRWPLLAFLMNHVWGEKLGRWAEALQGQRALLDAAQPAAAAVLWRQAATAARLAGGGPLADELARGFARACDADLACCTDVLGLSAAMYTAPALPALDAGAQVLAALAPLSAPAWQSASALDATVAACANNIASGFLDRPASELQHPGARAALQQSAETAHRFWTRAGTWVQHERALYLRAMASNALDEPHAALAHALEALSLLDTHDSEHAESVDRAFIELEAWHARRRLGHADDAAQALVRAQRLAEGFGDDSLTSWFDQRQQALNTLS